MYISFYFYFSNLFLPPKKQKHSPIHDICNEKRRKIDVDDDVKLSPPRNKKEISNVIEKQVLEILNTPLVEKKIASPSITTYSSILKVYFSITLKSIFFFFFKLKQKVKYFSLLILL